MINYHWLGLPGYNACWSVRFFKSAFKASGHIRSELIPVSVAWCDLEYFFSPLDGMLVQRLNLDCSIRSPAHLPVGHCASHKQ